jgi:integrase
MTPPDFFMRKAVSMRQSTRKPAKGKTGKPRPDFPLFPHATGRWAKKIRGKLVYFGKVTDDPKGDVALAKWLDQKDDLLAGRTPRVAGDGLTIRDLCNRFLTSKKAKLESGELAARSFGDYHRTCANIVKAFGVNRLVTDLDASDFGRLRAAMAKQWGPVTLGNEITRIRVLFRYAEQNQLVPTPVRYGSEFAKPTKKTLRKARAANGKRMLEADQLRRVLEEAGASMKAMILLGINCGFGNSDIASLAMSHLDLQAACVNYPRPKTGIERHCPLWPETVDAIKAAIAIRPEPKDKQHEELVFVTKYGGRWGTSEIQESEDGTVKLKTDDPIAKEFGKVLAELKLKRNGLGFYALRHTFETIAGDSRDQVAVDAIMGHARDEMASLYRERIEDARLLAVTEHVRRWLFATAPAMAQ